MQKKLKSDFEALTKAELATALGVSVQTVTAWLQRGLPTVSRPGTSDRSYRFRLADVVAWRVAQEAARHDAGAETDLEEAKRRKAVAEAELAEMQAAQQAGRLLAREAVDAAVVGAFARVRARLLAIPQQVAPLVVGTATVAEASAPITAAIRGALLELAETDVDALATPGADDATG